MSVVIKRAEPTAPWRSPLNVRCYIWPQKAEPRFERTVLHLSVGREPLRPALTLDFHYYSFVFSPSATDSGDRLRRYRELRGFIECSFSVRLDVRNFIKENWSLFLLWVWRQFGLEFVNLRNSGDFGEEVCFFRL